LAHNTHLGFLSARQNGIEAPCPSSSPTFAFPFNQVTGYRYQQRFVFDGHLADESQGCSLLSPKRNPFREYGGFRLAVPNGEKLV
jgi:hypothetical protein